MVAQSKDSSRFLDMNLSSFFSLASVTIKAPTKKKIPTIVAVRFSFSNLKALVISHGAKPPEEIVNTRNSRKLNLNSSKITKKPKIEDGINRIHPINLNLFGNRNLVSIFGRLKLSNKCNVYITYLQL